MSARMSALRALLFDLDGTLVQTRDSSWRVFQETNREFKLGVESPAAFFQLFEENFFDALDALARKRGVADPSQVGKHFQQKLRSDYLPEVVPGISAIVRQLASSYTLMIVSSNTMESVRRVLEENNLASCFAHVFSGEFAKRKMDAIGHVLGDPTYACGRQCLPYYNESATPHKHALDEVMLITDTVGDIEEARRAGIRTCGVAWGMHSADRLKAAGAEFVCVWPEELLVYLRDGRSADGGGCGIGAAPRTCSIDAGSVGAAADEAAAIRRSRRAPVGTAPPARSGSEPDGEAACCGEGEASTNCCEDRTPEQQESIVGEVRERDSSDPLLRSVLAVIGGG